MLTRNYTNYINKTKKRIEKKKRKKKNPKKKLTSQCITPIGIKCMALLWYYYNYQFKLGMTQKH